jgi:PAS domain S-box-containing protein
MGFVQTDADLRSLITGARDIIFACDGSGRFTFANPFAVELMGYEEHEILGRHFSTLIRPDYQEAAAKFYGRQFIARVRDTYFEFPAVRKSGDVVWLGQNVQLILDGNAIVGFQAIARDITRQKEAEAKLRESEAANRALIEQRMRTHTLEAVGQLAAGIAHHFNNLLTGILGYTELLTSHAGVPPEMRADLNEILTAARRASVLTKQLLTFSDPHTPRPETLDLNHVVHGLHGRLTRELRDNVTLVWEASPIPAMIRVDSEEIQNVIVQLVRNARDAMPSGGAIRLNAAIVTDPTSDLAGTYVRFSVADTGCGMDWETQSRMFEPFFTTKRQDEGTGLGLSVTHGIVRNCGGSIDVQSEINRGTIVTIYFPAVGAV